MTFLAIFLGILPSFIWLFFFLKEDIHSEPKKMIFKVFIAGILASAPAIALQFLFKSGLDFFDAVLNVAVSFLILATIEELVKFLAAYYMIKKNRFFDEPIDAMIYVITAALGFAAAENIFIALGGVLNHGKSLGELFAIITLRFAGATLLHALTSGFVGYYWAYGIIKRRVNLMILIGIVVASVLHAIFNYFILKYSATIIYPTIFLIITAFFIFWDFEKIKNVNK